MRPPAMIASQDNFPEMDRIAKTVLLDTFQYHQVTKQPT
jgi:hypothetical protein